MDDAVAGVFDHNGHGVPTDFHGARVGEYEAAAEFSILEREMGGSKICLLIVKTIYYFERHLTLDIEFLLGH